MTLDDVKAGDEVFIISRYDLPVKARVERTTPTRIVLAVGSFTRRGKEVGGSRWYGKRIKAVTPETERNADDQISEQKMKTRVNVARSGIGNLRIDSSNIDRVEAFLASLKE